MNLIAHMDWLAAQGFVITDNEILRWTGRSARTLRRWKQNGCPSWAIETITRLAGVVEAETARGSELWRISSSGLVTCPAGDVYRIGELRGISYIKAAADGHRRRWVALEAEIKQLRQQHAQAMAAAGLSASLPANDHAFLPSRQRDS